MNSREQFEVWQLDVYCGGQERLKRCSNDDSTYYFQDVQLKWKAWQASRAAIEVDLPEQFDKYDSGDFMYWADQVDKAIADAGLRVKP